MTTSPAAWAGGGRVLLRGGSVYSLADPFATAMLVHGDQIAWVGTEGAALALADGVDEVVDLDGALVTAAFVDALVARPRWSMEDLAGVRASGADAGVGTLHAVAESSEAGSELAEAISAFQGTAGPHVFGYAPSGRSPLHGRLLSAAELDAPTLAMELARASSDGVPAAVRAEDAAALATALAGLRLAAAEVGPGGLGTAGHRLHGAPGATAADIGLLAALGVAVVLTAERGFADVPVAELVAAGIPLALGSGSLPLQPWESVRAAVHHPDPMQRISARAAFAAHTRGGARAAGHPDQGLLVPGAVADYAIWEAGQLRVQAPDDRIQAWSTDPRSGTPGLPDLAEQTAAPRCLATVVGGRRFSAAASDGISRR